MKNKKAFTLVELIVVITILAILWTIWFISFAGYNVIARDTIRVSDLNNLSKVISLYRVEKWKFPKVTNSIDVSFSWATIWKQGSYGIDSHIDSQSLSNIPTDPLTWNEYAYSTTIGTWEYQVWGIAERGGVSYSLPVLGKSFAANLPIFNSAIVRWNYNGKFITYTEDVSQNTKNIYVLGVPSILSQDIIDTTLRQVHTNNRFVYPGSTNAPSTYSGAVTPGVTWNSGIADINGDIAVIYEGTNTELSGANGKIELINNIKDYYENSDVADSVDFQNIANIDTVTNSDLAVWIVNTFIKSGVWGFSESKTKVKTSSVVASVWNESWEWDDNLLSSNPNSCLEMTPDHLSNLNNWMRLDFGDIRWSIDTTWWELSMWTSNLTVSQWCNIQTLEWYWDDLAWPVGYIPEEIGYLEDLQFLSLADHNITEIPESLILLTNLQDVYFEGNQLWNLELSRFDWVDWYTCENDISDKWNDMCIELSSSGWGEFGEGPPPDGDEWDFWDEWSDGIRFVLKWIQHVTCEDIMTDAQLAWLNNWWAITFADRGPQVTINPTGSSSLTKSEWCSIDEIAADDPQRLDLFTYLPEGLSLLPKLQLLSFPNEDISILPSDFASLDNLSYIDFSWNTQLWDLGSVFNFDFSNTCDDVSDWVSLREICIDNGFENLLIYETAIQ